MRRNRMPIYLCLTGLALVAAAAIFLASAEPALAQCGSQSSSCKNCHEVQGQLPVNGDGTGWHTGHAFGDFCVICHAGNSQATDAVAAHEAMLAPMEDVQAACQQCHAADLEARAQVYADALGVSYGMGGAAPSPAEGVPASATGQASPAASASAGCDELVVDDANLVNYAARYDEIVLGKKPVNWGNTILMAMIGALVVGGGSYALVKEKVIRVTFGDTQKPPEGFPADVVDMLPALARMKGSARRTLRDVLSDPTKAERAVGLMKEALSQEEESKEE